MIETRMQIELTLEQSEAVEAIRSFFIDNATDVFVLTGSAGSGKTTMIARLVKVAVIGFEVRTLGVGAIAKKAQNSIGIEHWRKEPHKWVQHIFSPTPRPRPIQR